jgi:hypothetical protein
LPLEVPVEDAVIVLDAVILAVGVPVPVLDGVPVGV